jgi:hypothetical protein
MSKRDTFKRAIKGLTNTRSLKTAIRGWEFVHTISLPKSNAGAACELCGTRFWNGAFIRRPEKGGRKASAITVGGTCLETILRGSFADQKVVARRKAEVATRLQETYGELLGDAGNWVRWLIDHVPTRLKPLVAQLRYLGMVPTDAELNRLIAYHDAHRKYAAAALLPDLAVHDDDFIPKTLTINEAKRFFKLLTSSQWDKLLARCSTKYIEEEIGAWRDYGDLVKDAWTHLDSPEEERAIVALTAISDYLDWHDPERLAQVVTKLRSIPTPYIVPFFACTPSQGLAVVLDMSDEVPDEARAWIWQSGKDVTVDLTACRGVSGIRPELVFELELMAFWAPPPWLGPIRITKPVTASTKKQPTKVVRKEQAAIDKYESLSQIPCIANMLEIARYKGKTDLAEQFAWLRSRVRALGTPWDDFVFQIERYSTNDECREHVDRIIRRLCFR